MKLGLSQNQNANNKYLNMFEGSFRLRVNEGTPESITRVNKNGEQVSELVYQNVAGYIDDIFIKQTDYGRRLNLVLHAEDTYYYIQVGLTDYMAIAIYKMLPNIDPKKPIRVSLSKKPDDEGVERTSLFISQEDEHGDETPIKHKYTKANPQGMPEREKKVFNGEEKWDFTAQVEFLIKNAVEPFLAKLNGENQSSEEEIEIEVPPMNVEIDPFEGLKNPEDKPF